MKTADSVILRHIGVFDLKRRCAERSVYDIKVPRELFESIQIYRVYYRSRGTLMSHTDHSAPRRFKSHTPHVTDSAGSVRLEPTTDWKLRMTITKLNMHFVIRRYQPSDREAVEKVFREGIMEHINPAFMYAMTRPLHITVSLFFYIGAYVMSGQSVVLALVSGGAWIGLVYFCCYEFYTGYVRARLNTDMLDIPGYYLSNPDNCFWVAEAEIHGRPQVLGMVAVEGKSDPESGGKKYGELYRMMVSSTCRRSGLGIRLAKTAEDFCRERCFTKFKLSTSSTQKAAMALYFRLGFKLILVHTQSGSPKWMIWMTRAKILSMEKNIE